MYRTRFSLLTLPRSHIWFTRAASTEKFTPAFLSDKLSHRAYLLWESPDLRVEEISFCRFTLNVKTILPSSDFFFSHSIRGGRVMLYFLTRRFRGTESVCFQTTECKTPLASCWTPCPYLLPVFSCKSRGKCWLFQLLSHLMFQRAGGSSCVVGGPVFRTLSL